MTNNIFLQNSLLLVFSLCLTVENAQVPMEQDTLSISTDTTVVDSLYHDFQAGALTIDQYYLFLTFSVFSPDSLPSRYRTPLMPRDATPIIREVKRIYPRLNPETQSRIRPWIKPLPPKPIKERPK